MSLRKHPASFTISKDLRGREVVHNERYGIQDVYNGFAYVVGNGLAWAIIGSLAYLWLRSVLGA